MIKRFIIAFILLVLVGGGIVGFNLFREQAIGQFFANMPVPSLTVSTFEVEPVTWTPGIEAIGTVAAAQGVDLTVELPGIVEEVRFSANDRVTKDSILVRLQDDVPRADLAAAEAQAAHDKQTLDRAIELQKRGVSTDVTVESARAAATTSAAQVARSKAVLDQKHVRAPFAGTIGIPRIDEGQFISSGEVIATLQDLQTMRVDFTVPEQRFSQLKIGQPVEFGLTADAMSFRGSITGIDPKVDPVSRLVSVRAEMTNPEGRVNPGQFLQVRVILPTEQDIMAIPQTALVSSLYGDFVYVVREAKAPEPAVQPDGAASGAVAAEAEPAQPAEPAAKALAAYQVFVNVGRRTKGMVEITKGLSAGDQVVTAGQNRLFSGSPVTIDNTVNPLPAVADDMAKDNSAGAVDDTPEVAGE